MLDIRRPSHRQKNYLLDLQKIFSILYMWFIQLHSRPGHAWQINFPQKIEYHSGTKKKEMRSARDRADVWCWRTIIMIFVEVHGCVVSCINQKMSMVNVLDFLVAARQQAVLGDIMSHIIALLDTDLASTIVNIFYVLTFLQHRNKHFLHSKWPKTKKMNVEKSEWFAISKNKKYALSCSFDNVHKMRASIIGASSPFPLLHLLDQV